MARMSTVLSLASVLMLLGTAFPQPGGWPQLTVVSHASERLGPGVVYDRWELRSTSGPLVVHVTSVDLRDPHVALDVVTHGDSIVGPDEPLSSMADRRHAEAAINADYFDINESGAPLNVVATGGAFMHQPDAAAALVIGQDDRVTMGPVVLRASLVRAGSAASDTALAIDAINDWSTENGLSLITRAFGGDAGADLELVLTPQPNAPNATTYRVTAATAGLSHLLSLSGAQIAVVARGAEAVGRLSAFSMGDLVRLAFGGTPPPASIVAAVGGGPLLLLDGKPVADPAAPAPQETDVRYPVTGAGLSADGSTLWLVAVDGRAPARSVGITRPMLGALLAALGASQAMAFDSGGSTEMAVRRLGDADVSVANIPSDGRERSIADALLVLNTATPGPMAQAFVGSQQDVNAVLTGSHLQLHASAVDADLQPLVVDPTTVRYTTDGVGATVDAGGLLTAVAPGRTNIIGRVGTISSEPFPVDVVDRVDALSIGGYDRVVETGASDALSVSATTRDGRTIAIDRLAVGWSASGDGRVSASGAFAGGMVPGEATVTVRVGSAATTLALLVGEHVAPLTALDDPATMARTWRFTSSSALVDGGVDAMPAPDATASLHLRYDFAAAAGTRAAYADAAIPVGGEPLAVMVDVYGDANGEWLRGGYRNADGVMDTLTLARHVDWTGWRTLRAAIPGQARWPISFARLYAVETRRDAIEAGDLWFRNLSGVYAGPAQSATAAPSAAPQSPATPAPGPTPMESQPSS